MYQMIEFVITKQRNLIIRREITLGAIGARNVRSWTEECKFVEHSVRTLQVRSRVLFIYRGWHIPGRAAKIWRYRVEKHEQRQ